MKALAGITVLDLTRLLPGGTATQFLADHGAEVIKIEQPGAGDYARTMNPAVFARTNSGKKSVVLDLKPESGKNALRRLVRAADVLIEGFRPGVMARLQLAYDDLAAINPRLIYVSLTGYGQSGPNAGLAGHDINYIAMAGLLSTNLPVIPAVQLADLVGGAMQVQLRVLLALQERTHTGKGQYVDVSMTDGVRTLMVVPGDRLTGRYACYNVYACADETAVAVGALEPKFWAELCGRLGCQELIQHQFDDTRQPELKQRLADIFRQRTAREWFDLLRDWDCCVTPVRSVAEVASEVDALPPPGLGAHTREILKAAGLSDVELDELQNTAGGQVSNLQSGFQPDFTPMRLTRNFSEAGLKPASRLETCPTQEQVC